MSDHTSFKLTITLATPFYLAQTLTLDALLSAAIFKKTGLMGIEAIPHIPLSHKDGIFKGSSLFCHPRYRHVVVGRVMALRNKHDLSVDVFSPNKRGGKEYVYVDQKRGEYKACMNAYPGISADEVYFWGVGDMKAVADLLGNYILGIGKRSNAGAGEIIDIQCDKLDDDFSWVTQRGMPARPLPIQTWETMGGASRPFIPMAVSAPYWESKKVLAVFPDNLVA